MTDRRKVGDVLWIALQYAKSDRQSLIDAYRDDDLEVAVQEAKKDIASFERLQMRFFGTTKSELEIKMDEMIPLSIPEISKRLDNVL